MKTRAKIFSLELEHTFGISRWSHKVQKTFVVSLEQDGFTGYGEATQNAYYDVSVEKLKDAWEALVPFIEKYTLTRPEEFWEAIRRETGDFRFLMAALDEAAWDLYGKIQGKPIYKLWYSGTENLPVSTYTIGLDDLEVMKRKILEKPWPVYKIKLGTDHDEEIIRELRKITEKPFRVDANAAWDYEKTKRLAGIFKDMNVEFIEQPLPAGAWRDMRRLKEISPLPLIADESCRTFDDLPRVFDAFHGINVKLTKAGGLTEGKRMLETARRAGTYRMIGCMTESTVGISAAAQLLPAVHFADLDGPLLLKNDLAEGVKILPQGYAFPRVNGTGVRFKENL
jgi:L-alanine-DL-glutamate epimerase-like enolase superfamily enzyme